MTVAQEKTPELKKKPEKKTIWTTEEKNNHQTLYGCDILYPCREWFIRRCFY